MFAKRRLNILPTYFCLFSGAAAARITFWELRRYDEGYHASEVVNYGALKAHFETAITQHRSDPRRRFVFLQAPHSRAPLNATYEMFTYAMTYLQVMPAFLEVVFPFGSQHSPRDFHFSTISTDSRLVSSDRGFGINELSRSGRHVEVCYSLKSVERTPDINPWSIRQCSVYQKYDIETEQSTWIIVKGNSLMQDLITKHTLRETVQSGHQSEHAWSALTSAIDTHALIAAWAGENWHWYINELETQFQELTSPLLTLSSAGSSLIGPPARPPLQLPPQTIAAEQKIAPKMRTRPPARKWSFQTLPDTAKRSLSRSTMRSSTTYSGVEKTVPQETFQRSPQPAMDPFSFRDLPKVLSLQEKSNELLLILSSNCYIIERLQKSYKTAFESRDNASMVNQDVLSAFSRFQCDMDDIVDKLRMQRTRVETLTHMINERKAVLNSVLQEQGMKASNKLAEEAKVSTEKMEAMTKEMQYIARKTQVETVSMRAITLVTLFFLPGTFISTLMSTPIVDFSTSSSGFSGHNIGYGALQFFIVVSIPLMCLTFAAWYVVHWREKRRERHRDEENLSDTSHLR
ncbi:hypothetical protein EJ03DRAFT_223120 [Teratosphaeria nubilosa]|uniref:CorA-like transporter domain-containing protein n=1 Tax=Teratosphaeria nubilosa TaxID=161662 RepID=A0A6G1KXK7_9PEZI|nr:hypothetical protein EJ03DRAFT_223120 [Teratosphaeria nubilosa]